MYDNVTPTGWVIGIAVSILVVGGGWWYLFRRFPPQSEEEEETETPASAPTRPSITDVIMSRLTGASGPIESVAAPLPATSTNDAQRIAKPGNAVNESLTGNAVAGILDNISPDITAAREMIRFQAMVEAAERVIAGGKIGQTEAIELVFGCKRSGRADSPYARARAAVQARIAPAEPQYRDYPGPLAQLQPATNGHEE